MREERVVIGDVPARLYVPAGADALVLFGHGGGHSKDAPRFVELARRHAAGTGLAVVCIDAVDHGDRAPTGATGDIPSGWHSSATDQMVRDWHGVATALSSIGPAVAYVGFSMGALFGVPTVASTPSITTAVFVVGGVPTGDWSDDPSFGPVLRRAAAQLGHADVLMLNTTRDELFSAEDSTSLYAAVEARSKRQVFRDGAHDDWPDDLIRQSVDAVRRGSGRPGDAEATDARRVPGGPPAHGATTIPDFATHYFMANRTPFENLSELDDHEALVVMDQLNGARQRGEHHRLFGSTYLAMRRRTEQRLRDTFVAGGGRPRRATPHYFVLGESPWFRGLARDMSEFRVALDRFDDETTGITYGDSFEAMRVGPEMGFGDDSAPRPYHSAVYRLGELDDLIATFGMPDPAPDDSYTGYERRSMERFIEVQVWSDDVIPRWTGARGRH